MAQNIFVPDELSENNILLGELETKSPIDYEKIMQLYSDFYGSEIDQENTMQDMTMLWNAVLTLAVGAFLWWIRGTNADIDKVREDLKDHALSDISSQYKKWKFSAVHTNQNMKSSKQ